MRAESGKVEGDTPEAAGEKGELWRGSGVGEQNCGWGGPWKGQTCGGRFWAEQVIQVSCGMQEIANNVFAKVGVAQ